ncbi:uncharacterized protein LOC129589429 [Paramacrobiotus metropolitanus]|uniref:uncharacterized protein LOC129589429 n=1 Tax=Paramacrobiotus metropolitanus TaxID=2943436 RepID=UPI002445E7C9|nr:uncharacterized protein LOC129589429 [Paramacrobiotus metropolitanus]
MPNSVGSVSSTSNAEAAVVIDWDEWLRMDPERSWKQAAAELSDMDNLISRTSAKLVVMQGKVAESLKMERKTHLEEHAIDVELEKLEALTTEGADKAASESNSSAVET